MTVGNTNYFRSQGGGIIAMSIQNQPAVKSKPERKGKASSKKSSLKKTCTRTKSSA